MITHTCLGLIGLAEFQERLKADGYSRHTIHNYVGSVREFLRYLDRQGVALDGVDTSHVAAYVHTRLRRYRRAHRRLPPSVSGWRAHRVGGIQYFLQMTVSGWPRRPAPATVGEALDRAILQEYREQLGTSTDFAPGTIHGLLYEAARFLIWRREGAAGAEQGAVGLREVDAYLQTSAPRLRRTTAKTLTKRVAHFMSFLHLSGRALEDLSSRIVSPTLYQYESIPSVLAPEQIDAVLSAARRDRSAKGYRDYAILTLLATYGLRAGEVSALRLEDFNWRAETLTVTHTKTRALSILPLMPEVADAVFGYLRHGRPRGASRALFIRMRAPFRGLSVHHGIQPIVAERMEKAGIRTSGKQGPHIFRHARALSLLRARVPVKAIADILGHRSPRSTSAYLKLQTEDLRAVALPVPSHGEVRHERMA